mmetsp:Transcript_33327/g.51718  ORF Transcript_33327/g.51718 Transcript_33327/m.51718 type:complete len:323 (-) Transcript_33327:446-1414(-)
MSSRLSGGLSMSSRFTNDLQPWRIEVAVQSVPVSPPPMTTTRWPRTSMKEPSNSSFQSLLPLKGVLKLIAFSIRPSFWLKRARCCLPRKSIAKWMFFASRPGMLRSRGITAPVASSTASNLARSAAAVTGPLPTSTPQMKSTPSAWRSSMRRWTTRLSSFMFGIPYIISPPGFWSRSNTVTLCPIWFSSSAAASPAGPEPTTAMLAPERSLGMRALTQPSWNPRSMMEYSMFLMVTGAATRPATHAPSHGAGHTRPVNSGKLLVVNKRSKALFHCSLKTSSFHSGMRLWMGQPECVWQKGVPQSMQRADWRLRSTSCALTGV